MRRFWVLLRKEIKELVTPQILLPFAITVVMFMFIGNIVGSQGTEAQANRHLAMLDSDKSAASAALQGAVEQAGFKVDAVTANDAATALKDVAANGGTLLLVVPSGYGDALAAGKAAPLDVYSIIRTFSFLAGQDSSTLSATLTAVEQSVARQTIAGSAPTLDPAFVEHPLQVRDHVLVGDKQADVSPDVVMGFITGQTTFVPIVITDRKSVV